MFIMFFNMSISLFVDDPGKTLFPMYPTWADLNKLLYSIKKQSFYIYGQKNNSRIYFFPN